MDVNSFPKPETLIKELYDEEAFYNAINLIIKKGEGLERRVGTS